MTPHNQGDRLLQAGVPAARRHAARSQPRADRRTRWRRRNHRVLPASATCRGCRAGRGARGARRPRRETRSVRTVPEESSTPSLRGQLVNDADAGRLLCAWSAVGPAACAGRAGGPRRTREDALQKSRLVGAPPTIRRKRRGSKNEERKVWPHFFLPFTRLPPAELFSIINRVRALRHSLCWNLYRRRDQR